MALPATGRDLVPFAFLDEKLDTKEKTMSREFPTTFRPLRRTVGRRTFAGLGLALLVSVSIPAAAQEGATKIAVVDLDTIVARSPAGQALQAKLEKFQQEIRAEADRKAEHARDLRRQISEGVNTLSEDRLAELQKEYEDAQIAMRRYQDDKQREGQKMQSEGLREIEQQLGPIFLQIRDEEGWDLILNNTPGVVVIISPQADITERVLERLNAGQGG